MAKQNVGAQQELIPDGDYMTGDQYLRKGEEQLVEIQSYVNMDTGEVIYVGMAAVLLTDQSGNPVGRQPLGFQIEASDPTEALDKAPEAAKKALQELQNQHEGQIVSPGKPSPDVERKLRSGPTQRPNRKGKRRGGVIDLSQMKNGG